MNGKIATEVIKFEACNIPKPYENTTKSDNVYVDYGNDNLYPEFLLNQYGNSPTHSSIINAKATYIIGDGLKLSNGSDVNVRVNAADTFASFIGKIVKDYLIFNYFCVEVVYNAFNKPIELHSIPAHKIRTNKTKTKFWYSEDWLYSKKPIVYDRLKKNPTDANSKIFFFEGYFPSISNVYPTPEYVGSLKSIVTDGAIRDFNLNNIKNHFAVSTIITFFNGSNVPDDIKQKTLQTIKNSYTGENGNKIIIDFQDDNGKGAEVTNVSPNEWDKAYSVLRDAVSDDIYRGHQVTSPMLLGVKTEGQLGGATELETAYEIFKNTYIRQKRSELLSAFTKLFVETGFISGELIFKDRPLFNNDASEALKEKIFTLNELRSQYGLQALVDGDKLLSQLGTKSNFSKVEDERGDLKHLSDEDFGRISHLGCGKDLFEFISEGEYVATKEDFNRVELKFDEQSDIANYVLKIQKERISIDDLRIGVRKDLGIAITKADLLNTLSQLKDASVINYSVNNDTIELKPVASKEDRRVEVVYSYEVRPGLGEAVTPTTRPFCKRMIDNNRFYSRREIESMSELFGYDIFSYGGGFYHNPKTGTTTPHCRHQFKSYSVVRKK